MKTYSNPRKFIQCSYCLIDGDDGKVYLLEKDQHNFLRVYKKEEDIFGTDVRFLDLLMFFE